MKRFTSVSDVLELFAPAFEHRADWNDVLARAGEATVPRRRSWRRRWPLALVAAAALAAVAVAPTPGLGLGGRLVGLFSSEGEPVPPADLAPIDRDILVSFCRRVRLATPPGKPPEKRCAGGSPRLAEIANDGRRRYFKVTLPNGNVCLASGPARPRHDPLGRSGAIGSAICAGGRQSAAHLFPSPRRPITVDIVVQATRDDPQSRLWRVSGLAGEGVARVRLVAADGGVLETAVKGRAYTFARIPKRDWVAIVAVGKDGDEVYRERLPTERRARLVTRRPPQRPPKPPPPRAVPTPRSAPVQQGQADGAAIAVYRSGLVIVRFAPASPAYRLLWRSGTRDPNYAFTGQVRATLSCVKAAYGAGSWETLGWGTARPLAPTVAVSIPTERGGTPPPFDACSVSGHYGRKWNDPRGMGAPVEVAFTELGRRFLAERETARDLAWFVRSPQMDAIRLALKRGGGSAPTARAIARRFPSRVVALDTRAERPPPGVVGVWSDGRREIEVSETAADGRRLFIRLRGGRIAAHNLHSLAFVF